MSKPSKKTDSDEGFLTNKKKAATGPPSHHRTGLSADLKEAVKIIIRLACPQKIFWIGAYTDVLENKVYNDLLIVLPREMLRPHKEYATLVEYVSLTVCPLSATILKNGDYFKMLSAGHLHFTRFCRMENLLYTADDTPVPKPRALSVGELADRAEADFHNRFSHSKAFLEGAHFYAGKKQCGLAAFMLQQAIELAYRALTLGLTDHELYTNHLRSHLVKAYRCAPEIEEAFSPANEADLRLLQLLETAYIQGRYNAHFKITSADLNQILNKAALLQEIMAKTFETRLESIIAVLKEL